MSGSISNRILEVDVKTFEICRREDWKEIRESDLLVDKAKNQAAKVCMCLVCWLFSFNRNGLGRLKPR